MAHAMRRAAALIPADSTRDLGSSASTSDHRVHASAGVAEDDEGDEDQFEEVNP